MWVLFSPLLGCVLLLSVLILFGLSSHRSWKCGEEVVPPPQPGIHPNHFWQQLDRNWTDHCRKYMDETYESRQSIHLSFLLIFIIRVFRRSFCLHCILYSFPLHITSLLLVTEIHNSLLHELIIMIIIIIVVICGWLSSFFMTHRQKNCWRMEFHSLIETVAISCSCGIQHFSLPYGNSLKQCTVDPSEGFLIITIGLDSGLQILFVGVN